MMIKVKIIIHLNSFFFITHICSQSSYKSHITHIQLTCLLFILHTLFSLLSSCSIRKNVKKYFMYSSIPFYVALFIGLGRNIPSSATTCNFAALDYNCLKSNLNDFPAKCSITRICESQAFFPPDFLQSFL